MAEPSCMVSGPDLEDPTSPYEEELEERRAAKEDQEAQHNSSVPKEGNTALERKKTNTYYSKHHRGWRHLVRNFTPSWFAVTMGTGISSILLHQLPYNAHWLHIISYIVFCLNIFLFVTFFFISLLRYTLYPQIWSAMIKHPQQSLFLGTFPMGLATIVNMVALACVPAWGGNWWKLAWALWWIDVVISVATCFYLPFAIMSVHESPLHTMTAAWLLPIVATIVAGASGGIVAAIIPNHREALITVITSYVLLGTGLPLALTVLVIYFLRLTTSTLPPNEVIVSTFLPLGPLGQGGFGIQQLGKVAMTLFHHTHTLPESTLVYAGDVFYIIGFLVAIILWGFGLVWLFFALATIYHSKRFPFNMGWWGFTFPLGVYATSTISMSQSLPSGFFKVVATIFALSVVGLWMVVSVGTIYRAITGEIFYAPCLKDMDAVEAAGPRRWGLGKRLKQEMKGDV